MFRSGRAKGFKEQELLADFLNDVFCDVLGYKRPADDAERYTFSREKHVKVDNKFADAVLGNFRPSGNEYTVALEGKGPLDPLDRPHAGRKMSAVDQGYRYAINLPADWIIVTSIRETRLYHKNSNQHTFERFEIERLADEEAARKRFVFLLGADRVVPASGRCHLYELLAASEKVGKELTHDFYARYAEMRQNAFGQLCDDNPEVSRLDLLSATQKLLDRILFVSFCEDRGLLPEDTIKGAYEHRDPYHPRPIWHNFRGLFRAIDTGNEGLKIPAYNGGLFAVDDVLDNLELTDGVCAYFQELADYEYRSPADVSAENESDGQLIDVDILGHIFEQSITDLERIRNNIDSPEVTKPREQKKTRRKKEGAFYTPAFITRYIVEQTLGGVLKERFEKLRQQHQTKAKGTARKALESPEVYELEKLKEPQRKALVKFWEAWQDELKTVSVLDPACGSGAFLIEAFDQLHTVYQSSNDRLEELRGSRSLFDPDRQILQHNLYGVDLNDEAVEICRLSLWIKTAARGKVLTSLDHTIRVGNSVVTDSEVHPRAFDWTTAFPEVTNSGGFDVVIGNPPYIRQEWLKPYKAFWEKRFKSYSGTADIFTYFFELGIERLREDGRLGFITSGTFTRAKFAIPFRKWLASVGRFHSLVNFGENQPFEDAEMVYPTISILRKSTQPGSFPALFIRERIPESLDEAMQTEAVVCDEKVFEGAEWLFQKKAVTQLSERLMKVGKPLSVVCRGRMHYGVKTGLNEAFIIDRSTRDRLIESDPRSDHIIKPFVRGEDLRPWYQEDEDRWMIFTRRGIRIDDFPAVKDFLSTYRERLEPRPKELPSGEKWPGRKAGAYEWYELQDSVDYWSEFDKPKVFWPDIAKLPRFSWDESGLIVNDKGFIVTLDSPWILAILQSRVSWFCLSQLCVPLRLRGGLWQFQCKKQFVQRLRVPDLGITEQKSLGELAMAAVSISRERYLHHCSARRRISVDLADPPGELSDRQRLYSWWNLDFSEFRREVKKQFRKDLPVRERDEWDGALRQWKDKHNSLSAKLIDVEAEVNDRVYHAFSMSADERKLFEEHEMHAMIDYKFGEP